MSDRNRQVDQPERDAGFSGDGGSSKARRLSHALLDLLRGVGIERGADVALTLLFFRSLSAGPGAKAWDDIVGAGNAAEQVRAYLSAGRAYLPPELAGSDGSTDVSRVLPALAHFIDKAIPGPGALCRETFEALLAQVSGYTRESGERETPAEVAQLLARLTVKPRGTILDPAAGQGNALVSAIEQTDGNIQALGVEVNAEVARRLYMRLSMTRARFHVRTGDAFAQVRQSFADAVVLQPPWGLTLTTDRRFRATQPSKSNLIAADAAFTHGDFPWLVLAQAALRPGGHAAVVLPHNLLNRSKRAEHRLLLAGLHVEGIISLPGTRIFTHSSIRAAVWLLRGPGISPAESNRMLLVDAESLLTPTQGDRDGTRGVDALVELVESFRSTGAISAPGHVARVVDATEIDLARGLAPQSYLSQPPQEVITHPRPERRMITRLSIANFKAFGTNTEVGVAPLTLLFGANSAGKSTLIQALLLLKQSLASDYLVTQGPMADLGAFPGIVHRQESHPIRIGLEYGALPTWLPSDGTPDPSLLRRVRWTFEQNLSGLGSLTNMTVGFGNHEVAYEPDLDNADLLGLSLDSLAAMADDAIGNDLLYTAGATSKAPDQKAYRQRLKSRARRAVAAIRQLQTHDNGSLFVMRRGLTPTSETILPWSIIGALSDSEQTAVKTYTNHVAQLGAGIGAEVRAMLSDVAYLGPLRSAPQRFYDRATTSPASGAGQHVAMFLFDNSSVLDQVNSWLKQLEVPYVLDVLPVQAPGAQHLVGDLVALSLTDERSGVSVTPADVGFGISQVLPIIVELLSRRESIVCVEQPETHLHPRLQAHLADLFIEATQEEGRANQLIVETHSEHLILRIQKRIREGALAPSHVAVVYVDQSPEGHTVTKLLRLDEQGNFLDEWPNGFFDDRLDELFGDI